MVKRILIVDDEESLVFFLGEDLAKLGAGYQIEKAYSGQEALSRMAAQPFDLIITDLRMPGMDGLTLMEKIRARHPHTRLILMTAYGDARIEAIAYRLGVCRYLNKPFRTEELIGAVHAALAEPEAPGRDILVLADDRFDAIAQCLSDLQFEVGAQCILLADVSGQLVAHVGETEGLDLPALISLVGGSFATAFEMARYLGENQALTLNYHEGRRYDVYTSNVNEELFVVLLFDKRHQRSRIGMVWLYTRRTLKQLQDLVGGAERVNAGQVLDADFGVLLSDSMDQLFVVSEAEPQTPGGQVEQQDLEPPGVDGNSTLEEATTLLQETLFDPPMPEALPPAAGDVSSPTEKTFSLQQALEMGLLDPSWVDNADGER